MHATLDNDGTIRRATESYAPWPRFRPGGVRVYAGRWNARHLADILGDDDLFCWTWRRTVPADVLAVLRLFPEGHAELLETAQLDPVRFVSLGRTNPALLALVSAYWIYHGWRRMPPLRQRNARRAALLKMRGRDILGALRLPPLREGVRILAKVPATECEASLIEPVLCCLFPPRTRLRLRHLPRVNADVARLLRLPEPVLDTGILRLAATAPHHLGGSVGDFVVSIINKREKLGLHPAWPYRNTVTTWPALVRAEARMAARCGMLPETLPSPPLSCALAPPGLRLEALMTAGALHAEACAMNNCAEQYLESVRYYERYLYRVLAPERATLLLANRAGVWKIEEIGTPGNGEPVRPETTALVTRWIDHANAHRAEEETRD